MRMKLKLLSLCLLVFGTACSPVLSLRPMRGNKIAYYTAEGGVVIQGNTRSKHGMCVMPPAQAVRQRTGEGSGNITVKGSKAVEVSAGVEAKTEHDVTKLYDQTAATLFMQHGLYRVCEMAANGAFDTFKPGTLVANGFDTAAYQAMVKEVLRQSYDLIIAESEAARARQLEAIESIADKLTPEDARGATSMYNAIINAEARIAAAMGAIAAATTTDALVPHLNDPEPRIRRAANAKRWRLEDEAKIKVEAEAKAAADAKAAAPAPPRK